MNTDELGPAVFVGLCSSGCTQKDAVVASVRYACRAWGPCEGGGLDFDTAIKRLPAGIVNGRFWLPRSVRMWFDVSFNSTYGESMSNEERLWAIANEAVDVFTKLYEGAAVSGGSTTSGLQAQGITGNSIAIDCAKTNKRIIVVCIDAKPGEFAISVFDRENPGDVAHEELPIKQLNTSTLLKYMDANFAT
ncbi:MAG: hypothetical protein ACI89F_000575 [Porticoccaceae bacterium]|jgi:hypothetical protein